MATIEIRWKKMGPEFTYNVWYSKSQIGPWIQHNKIFLTEDSILHRLGQEEGTNSSDPYAAENIYLIDGLASNTEYYVKITCGDRYNKWWYSYSGVASLDGGLFDPSSRPSPAWRNTLSFQVDITGVGPEPIPYGEGPYGEGPYGY